MSFSTYSSELVGILESTRGSRYATIDGEEYEIDNLNGATVGDIVVFTNDEEDGIAVVRYYNTAIIDGVENEWIVKDAVEARFVEMYASDVTLDLDVEDKIEGKDVEDYRFFMVEAEEDEAGVYEFTSMDEVDFEDIKLKDDDRLYIDNTNGYLFIIRGIEVSD